MLVHCLQLFVQQFQRSLQNVSIYSLKKKSRKFLKLQFPRARRQPAAGHLIVWCSGQLSRSCRPDGPSRCTRQQLPNAVHGSARYACWRGVAESPGRKRGVLCNVQLIGVDYTVINWWIFLWKIIVEMVAIPGMSSSAGGGSVLKSRKDNESSCKHNFNRVSRETLVNIHTLFWGWSDLHFRRAKIS
jgi:hypothetical protein